MSIKDVRPDIYFNANFVSLANMATGKQMSETPKIGRRTVR